MYVTLETGQENVCQFNLFCGTSTKSAELDQTPQDAAKMYYQGLHGLLTECSIKI